MVMCAQKESLLLLLRVTGRSKVKVVACATLGTSPRTIATQAGDELQLDQEVVGAVPLSRSTVREPVLPLAY
jgi:hypothetical protein